MRSVDRPDDTAGDTFALCISKVKDPALQDRFAATRQDVAAASVEYSARVLSTSLHGMSKYVPTEEKASVAELQANYTERMAKSKAPGRPVYDRLKAAPELGRCPFCGQRTVSQLDHFLAKTHFPLLAVTPDNLVGICADCNKSKLDVNPACPEEQFIHPYFDDLGQDVFLRATLNRAKEPAAVFSVVAPPRWTVELERRVVFQFEKLSLGLLYSSHAAEEMLNIRAQLMGLSLAGGVNAVRAHLEEAAASRQSVHVNSWQSALYACLALDAWYCEEGHRFGEPPQRGQ